ncbi:MAG: hypothetical protein ACQEP5_08835, partial [Actinomycetota bacterium]
MLKSRILSTLFFIVLSAVLIVPAGIYAEGEENTAPVLLVEPSVNPESPKTNHNIDVSYGFYDSDDDQESGTVINWYKVGVEDPLETNIYEAGNEIAKVLDSSHTSKGEEWYATVQPKDGKDYGDVYTSNTVTIINSPPILGSGVAITPGSPTAADSLKSSYDFHDFDGDSEDGT